MGDVCVCGVCFLEGGVISMLRKACTVLASSWKMASGLLLVKSVLCSRRMVRDGWRRPRMRLGIIALHTEMFCTSVGMWFG